MSAGLMTLAYPQSTAWLRWLVFIALVPLIRFLEETDTKKQAFWGMFLWAFLFLGWNIRWFFAVLPAEWAGIENPWVGALFVGVIWLITTAVLALPMAVVGAAYTEFRRKYPAAGHYVFLLPSLWILGEYGRAWLFSIFWAGPDSLLGPHWTFGFLSYALTNFPIMLQSSKLFGVYGAGFLVVFLNVCVARGFYEVKLRKPFTKLNFVKAGLLIGSLTTLLFYGALQLAKNRAPIGDSKKIVLIQTHADHYKTTTPKEFAEFIEKELSLLRTATVHKPDIIVLPEGSRLTLRFSEQTPMILADTFGADRPTVIVDSARMSQDGPSKERVFVYDASRGLIAISDKTLTIPGGEYLPHILTAPLSFFGQGEWLDRFATMRHIRTGKRAPDTMLDPRHQSLGIQLCSAVLAPSLWRNPVKNENAELLVNAASQGLFRGSAFHDQALMWLRFFAASNDRWIVQAANSGYSYIIDNTGTVRGRTDTFRFQTLAGAVQYRTTKTPYVRFGDWPLLAALIIVVIGITAPIKHSDAPPYDNHSSGAK